MAIKCPKCQFDNTDTARFCSNCATQLTPGGQPPAALTKTLESPAYVLSKGSLIAGKYRILEEKGNRMFVVDILRTEPDFAVSKPRQLFELPGFLRTAPFRSYDLTRDEQRFLMFKREEKEPQVATEMVLVQNWFDELKRLVPTGKNW